MAGEHIWRLDADGDPTPLSEAPYRDEDALQRLIADHPEVLAGEQMTPGEPRRWLLIRREMGIADSDKSGNRWSVDHLLIDQDARPTLVEVKLKDNSDIHRKVVGQLLEYAAHATAYWTADGIRRRFEVKHGSEEAAREAFARWRAAGGEPESEDDGYEAFWEDVDTNLRADNVRLLFAADRIPDELAHVVGFLNRNMEHVEVLAVELRQFGGEGAHTLVPRVIGRTERQRTSSGGSKHTMETLLAEFPEGAVREAARQLLERSTVAGATHEFGPSGVSIRGHTSLWKQPVTVAWLFPAGVGGWMKTRDFSFGAAILEAEPPPALREVLVRHVQRFKDDPYTRDARSKGVEASYVAPEDAATHIEALAGRVEAVLRELAAL